MNDATWSAASRRDLRGALDYYKRLDENLALRIVEAIAAKGAWLADFPGTGSLVRKRLRKSLVAGTPYLILYQSTNNGITIVRVHHVRQNWR